MSQRILGFQARILQINFLYNDSITVLYKVKFCNLHRKVQSRIKKDKYFYIWLYLVGENIMQLAYDFDYKYRFKQSGTLILFLPRTTVH